MPAEPDDLRILRLHKTWANGYTLLWQGIIVLLFAAVYVLSEQAGVDASERACALILLATMVLAASIWQAVGLGVARIHMLLKGIDLERRSNGNMPAQRDRI
jgi:hypothetical protein